MIDGWIYVLILDGLGLGARNKGLDFVIIVNITKVHCFRQWT